jgi:alpha-beta hydrolase superfamily lysophospholipase
VGQEVASFEAADGTKLWRRRWTRTGAQRGVLVIQHGLRDHSENYDRLARRAVSAGFSVWAADLRGHARSAGPRVRPTPWRDYIDDFDRLLAIVRAAEPGQPIFVMGHSMGGTIAALTVIDRRPANVAGLILSAPALHLGIPPLVVAATRMLGTVAPSLGVLKLDPKAFSTDPRAADKLVNDPLVEQGAGPASTAAGLAAAAAEIWTRLDRLILPILALHGTRDQLTAPSGSRSLIALAPSRDKTLRIYEGLAHDLVHEPDGAKVEDDVLAWLAAHTGGPAVSPPPLHEGALKGDAREQLASLRLGGGVASRGDNERTTTGVFELATHLGFGAPLGWGGALAMRVSGAGFQAGLLPLGGTIRVGSGGFGVAAGISTIPDGFHAAIPVRAWLELPLGVLHATVAGQADYRLSGSPRRAAVLSADQLELSISIRVPENQRYWPPVVAGVGPYVGGSYIDTGTGDASFTITVGVSLYGAD